MLAGAVSSESLSGAGGSTSKLTLMLLVGGEASVPGHVDPSVGMLECPYNMAAVFT